MNTALFLLLLLGPFALPLLLLRRQTLRIAESRRKDQP